MTCEKCKAKGLIVNEVELCPKHAMADQLAEALRGYVRDGSRGSNITVSQEVVAKGLLAQYDVTRERRGGVDGR